MAEANIQAGDVVRLKSGGQKMSVDGFQTWVGFFGKQYINPEVVCCTWWDEDSGEFKEDFFSVCTLKKV